MSRVKRPLFSDEKQLIPSSHLTILVIAVAYWGNSLPPAVRLSLPDSPDRARWRWIQDRQGYGKIHSHCPGNWLPPLRVC